MMGENGYRDHHDGDLFHQGTQKQQYQHHESKDNVGGN